MVSYKDRLAFAMQEARVHPQALADHLGVALQTVRKVLAGGSAAFNVPNHFEACRFLGVDAGWLATGEGDRRSGQTWPFGTTITPDQFFALDATVIQGVTDQLEAAVRRHSLMTKVMGPPAPDSRVSTFISPAPRHELDSGFGGIEEPRTKAGSYQGKDLPPHHPAAKKSSGKGRKEG